MYASLLLVTCLVSATPDVWPGFLGQGHSAIAADSLPLTWSPEERPGWVSTLPGQGQSSPIVWKDRVYVTSIEGTMKDHCHITAFGLADGSTLWNRTVDAAQMVRSNYFQSRSAPTPCADENGVYVFFETGNLLALTHSGEIAWQRALTDDYGPFESTIGLASSPLQLNDRLFLLIDHEGPSYLLAVDKKTGETLWLTERDSRVSYASPALVPVGNRQHIVCSSSGSIEGYDPETGERLWTLRDEVGGNRATTPLPCGDGRFVMAASPGMHNENDAEARRTNGIVAIERAGTGYAAKVLWRTERAMPAFNTPTVSGGLAYWVNRVGVLFCFDAETGEELFAKRLKQGCWATPVAVGDRLYVFGKDGVTSVVQIGRDFQLLAENSLWRTDEAGDESQFRRQAAGDDATRHGNSDQASEKTAERASGRPDGTPAGSSQAESRQSESRPQSESEQAGSAPSGSGNAASARGSAAPPVRTPEEVERLRQQGANRFADPVQYGVAVINGHVVIRTGQKVYCIRPTR